MLFKEERIFGILKKKKYLQLLVVLASFSLLGLSTDKVFVLILF